ncbi:hypothetical protein D1N55_10565 [Clostridioides difficile]|nr:hypothetical protein D1N55_10565 [Clostridioides difficile]
MNSNLLRNRYILIKIDTYIPRIKNSQDSTQGYTYKELK